MDFVVAGVFADDEIMNCLLSVERVSVLCRVVDDV